LLFVAVSLPTGSIFGLNVKTILFAVCAASFAFFIVTHSYHWPTLSEQIFLGTFFGGLCLWSLIAVLNGETKAQQIFLQLKDICSTVLMAWLTSFFVRRKLIQPESVVRTVVYAAVAVGLIKVGLIFGLLIWSVDPATMIESIFGEASLVSGEIAFGLTRLGFSSDVVGGFALFAILCPSVSGIRFKRRWTPLLIASLLISGLISYGRYIWFIDLFAIISALVIERRFRLLMYWGFAIIVIGTYSFDVLSPVLTTRFSSDQTSDSDLTRIEQSRALLDEIETRPIFGKGIGQHAHDLIRSEQNLYSYELQWMSLTMQMGIVGIAGISLLVASTTRDLLAARHRAKPWLAVMFGLWLLGGWTNPYIVSSFAGATFGMFMAVFYRMRMLTDSVPTGSAVPA
jgi:hypothetical protein